MKTTNFIKFLSVLVLISACSAAFVGLFWQSDGEPFFTTTIHGESVKLYGSGLYKYDTYFKAAINKGTDGATLFIAVPLLLLAIVLSGRGIRGMLFLAGMLSYFLYYSICLALGVSNNFMFPVYIFMFSASLFAFINCILKLSNVDFSGIVSAKLPYKGIAIFLILAGLSVCVWMVEIIGNAVSGNPPTNLAIYTSEPTLVLDPAVIGPAAIASAVMLLRKKTSGYIGAAVLLTLNSLIGVVVLSQTAVQRLAGITLGMGELIAFVGVFVVMAAFAIGLNIRLFQNIKE